MTYAATTGNAADTTLATTRIKVAVNFRQLFAPVGGSMYGRFGVVLPIASLGSNGLNVFASFAVTLTSGTLIVVPAVSSVSAPSALASASTYHRFSLP